MEARNQRLEEHRDDLREGRTAFPQAPTNTAVRGANSIRRFNALSGVALDTPLTWSPLIDQVRKKKLPKG